MTQRSGWLLGCALAAIVLTAPAAQASRTATVFVGAKWATATFTENNAPETDYQDTVTYDQTIIDEAVTLLDKAEPGSVVRIALHSLNNEDKFEQALDRARNRGVVVGVVFGGNPLNLSDWNSSPGNLTWYKACDADSNVDPFGTTGAGCLSGQTGSEMHAKFMTFERIMHNGAIQNNVVWITSANMVQTSGARPFNNALTVYGATQLHEKLKTVWNDMYNSGEGSNDYYNPATGKGYFKTPDLETVDDEDTWGYVSPDSDPNADMWAGRLDDIHTPRDPRYPNDPGGPCEVYAMQTFIDPENARPAPVDQLVRLKQQGCIVTTVVNKEDGGGYGIGTSARKKLYCAQVPVRYARVHDKVVITKSTTEGTDNRPQVMTGSQNMTRNGLRLHDDLITRTFESVSLYNAYKGHYDDAYSTRAVPFSGTC